MDNKNISLNFNAKIKSFERINENFTKCRCYIMALGKNRNFSHFDMEVVNDALPTIYNIPVIGHLIEKEDGTVYMGSHDMELVKTDDGYSFKSICVPYGVVPQQDNLTYETITEDNGDVVTYLVGDIILWTGRYQELNDAVYNQDVYFNQSMEILFSDSRPLPEDKNYTDVLKFTFDALCLLGKADDKTSVEHSEPCFPSSRVIPYKFELNNEFSKLMNELKTEITNCFEVKKKKEGEDLDFTEEIRDQILSEFELSLSDIDFEIDESMDATKFRELCKDFACKKKKKMSLTKSQEFAATYNERYSMIREALNQKNVWDGENELYHYIVDFDDTYTYVERCVWNCNGYNETKGRFTYTIDEVNKSVNMSADFEEMVSKWLTLEENDKLEQSRNAFELLTEEFNVYKSEYETPNAVVEDLRKFKSDKLAEEFKLAVDTVLSEFSDLESNEEFKALKNKALDFENIEDLRKECYVILGKSTKTRFSAKQNNKTTSPVKLPVSDHSEIENEPYGGAFRLYGNK